MALTDAQMTDCRRYMGYALAGTTMPITADQDLVYGQFGLVTMSLYKRLTTLTASEEAVVDTYLTNLNALEIAIVGAGANLDTDIAAVWTRNKTEVADRTALYRQQRRELCGILGFPPGPGLGSGNSLSRC